MKYKIIATDLDKTLLGEDRRVSPENWAAIRRLTEMGLSFPEPKGAFYVFPDISGFGLTDEEFCTRLITEGGVATVPGSCFGTPGHIRISYCCSDEALTEGMNRLETFIGTL